VLSGSVVSRKLILLERDEYGARQAVEVRATIALAYCKACKRRTRVLPSDVLPRKVYSLALIEHQLARYTEGELSLRQVSWDLLGSPAGLVEARVEARC
jgi:hypothetical protein